MKNTQQIKFKIVYQLICLDKFTCNSSNKWSDSGEVKNINSVKDFINYIRKEYDIKSRRISKERCLDWTFTDINKRFFGFETAKYVYVVNYFFKKVLDI